MSKYKLIESVLGGIYGAQIGLSDDEAIATLRKDLQQPQFRGGFEQELRMAFNDRSLSWVKLLNENEVSYFETEVDALAFAKEFLWDVTFKAEQ